MPPCHSLVIALPHCYPVAIHKELLQAAGFAIFTWARLWVDGGWGGCSFYFYFGPVACERDSYCYCREGLFSVSSDLSEVHSIVIQLCQHADCWVGETTFSHFSASLDLFQVALYHKPLSPLPLILALRFSTVATVCIAHSYHIPLVLSRHADSFWLVFQCLEHLKWNCIHLRTEQKWIYKTPNYVYTARSM